MVFCLTVNCFKVFFDKSISYSVKVDLYADSVMQTCLINLDRDSATRLQRPDLGGPRNHVLPNASRTNRAEIFDFEKQRLHLAFIID
jgi:hypothetical protein